MWFWHILPQLVGNNQQAVLSRQPGRTQHTPFANFRSVRLSGLPAPLTLPQLSTPPPPPGNHPFPPPHHLVTTHDSAHAPPPHKPSVSHPPPTHPRHNPSAPPYRSSMSSSFLASSTSATAALICSGVTCSNTAQHSMTQHVTPFDFARLACSLCASIGVLAGPASQHTCWQSYN